MQEIVLHRAGCPQLIESRHGLHVAVEELESLAGKVFRLMQQYEIPFYQVVPHHEFCPGRHFPWEDLEFQLFTLEH